MMRPPWAIGLLLATLAACAKPPPAPVAAAPPPAPCVQTGMASWYSPKAAAKPTASGETPGAGALVAAHATLPFGTRVRVTEVASGRSVVVRVADRGPFAKGRIIDLSPAAAKQLGMRDDGVAQVRLEIDQASDGAAGVKPASMTDGACPFPKDTAA
jgi:rare lipoprotein A